MSAKWVRVDPGAMMRAAEPGTRCYHRLVADGHLMVLVGKVASPDYDRPLWHLSISHRTNDHPPQPGRYPDWDEITEARYRFIPDAVRVAMLLPPRAEWVNVHETCFHLWELEAAEVVARG